MSDYINKYKIEFNKVIDFFQKEASGLRIGRATPGLVEDIIVEAYGSKSALKELASIATTDPKTLSIQPWDKSLLKAIETALQQANLGASPIVKENLIIISLPPMTEENRLNMIKKLNQKAEEAKVALRAQREKVREQIGTDEKNKLLSEDEKFRYQEELETLVKQFNEKIKELAEKKEGEIKQI